MSNHLVNLARRGAGLGAWSIPKKNDGVELIHDAYPYFNDIMVSDVPAESRSLDKPAEPSASIISTPADKKDVPSEPNNAPHNGALTMPMATDNKRITKEDTSSDFVGIDHDTSVAHQETGLTPKEEKSTPITESTNTQPPVLNERQKISPTPIRVGLDQSIEKNSPIESIPIESIPIESIPTVPQQSATKVDMVRIVNTAEPVAEHVNKLTESKHVIAPEVAMNTFITPQNVKGITKDQTDSPASTSVADLCPPASPPSVQVPIKPNKGAIKTHPLNKTESIVITPKKQVSPPKAGLPGHGDRRPENAPTVQVHIGRVEVRAVQNQKPPPSVPQAPAKCGFDDYFMMRNYKYSE